MPHSEQTNNQLQPPLSKSSAPLKRSSVLGCRSLLSHKPQGVAIQIYCALIAALLMSQLLGSSVGKRGFELVCLYLSGWAEEDELLAGLQRLARQKANP